MTNPPSGFEYRLAGDDVLITHRGRPATTLRGEAARRFLAAVDEDDPQELMARLTGNYKRGNERAAKDHPRNRTRARPGIRVANVTADRRLLLALLAPLVALPAGPAAASATGRAHAARAAGSQFAGRIAIRGHRKLWLECRGRGSPTVLLEAGSGNTARVWHAHLPGRPAVLPGVARFTRVCAYDRPGTIWTGGEGQRKGLSRSDPVAMPRAAADLALDLRALLRRARALPRARIHGPYVLAGHSFGGMVARLLTTEHPGRIAGLVSIDAQSEWFIAAYKRLLAPEQYAALDAGTAPPPFAGYRDFERLSVGPSGAEMRQAQADTPIRRLPAVILSHSLTDPNPFGFPPDWPVAALNRAFNRSQARLARTMPWARHVIATRSAHYIQLDQPRLVIRAIRSVVAQVRRR